MNRQRPHPFRRTALLPILAFLAAACSSSPTGLSSDPVATGLEVQPTPGTLAPGDTVQLTATPVDGQGNPVPGYIIDWSSSDTTVTTVSDSGLVAALSVGSSTITATGHGKGADNGGGKKKGLIKKSVSVTVDTASSDSTTNTGSTGSSALVSNLTPSTYELDTLAVGVIYYVDRTDTVGSVPSAYRGWTLIKTANNDKKITSDTAVTFNLSDSATVAIAYDSRATTLPSWLTSWTNTGQTLQVSDLSSPMPIRTKVFGPGTVVLGGNLSGGASGAQSMYVPFLNAGASGSPPPASVASVTVTPDSASVSVGSTVQYRATVEDSAGSTLSGRSVSWSSSNTSVVTVNSSGLASGQSSGSATLTATSEGVSGTATLVVAAPPPPPSSSGSLQVSASTTGSNLDPDGYTVTVDGGSAKALATNGSVTYAGLSAASHSVTLSGIASNCSVSGSNPVTVSVPDGGTTSTTFNLSCTSTAPPPSGSVRITGITIDASSLNRFANMGDGYPTTWADDGNLYTAGGDGNGWDGVDTRGLDVDRLSGLPTGDLQANGTEVHSKTGVLPVGLISVGGALYLVEQERGNGFDQIRIGKSTDHGVTWSYLVDPSTGWTYSGNFPSLYFVQAGQDNASAPDSYVYGVSENCSGTPLCDGIDLLRVPSSSDLRDPANHQYFAGLDAQGNPTWTTNLANKKPVFSRTGAVHWGATMNYNPVLHRYVLADFTDLSGTLALYEAPKPWGPFTKVYEGTLVDSTEKFTVSFVDKDGWLSSDGKTWWFVVSGTGSWDAFNVLKATLTVTGGTQTDSIPPAAPRSLTVDTSRVQ